MMKAFLKSSALSVILATSAAQAEEGEPEFQTKMGNGYVAVDCDLLKEGKLTLEFIRSFGQPGHMDRQDNQLSNTLNDRLRAVAYINHIGSHHGGRDEVLRALNHGKDICNEDHPEKSGLLEANEL